MKKGVNGGCFSVEEVSTASAKLEIDYVLGMLTDGECMKYKKLWGTRGFFYGSRDFFRVKA